MCDICSEFYCHLEIYEMYFFLLFTSEVKTKRVRFHALGHLFGCKIFCIVLIFITIQIPLILIGLQDMFSNLLIFMSIFSDCVAINRESVLLAYFTLKK
jgi:uncharacterized membrane protein